MKFERDLDKSDATYIVRGFDFAFATGIFAGFTVGVVDDWRAYGEVRIRAIAGVTLVVVFTDRNDIRRIISARMANGKERLLWLNLFA